MGCTVSSKAQSAKELEFLDNYREVYFDSAGKLVKYNPHSNITAAQELQFVQENDNIPLQPGDECYILSTAWISEWALYATGDNTVRVGPIRNEGLVNDKQKMKLKVKLKRDYRTVNKAIWEYLFQCHGGGPVIFFSVPLGLDDAMYTSNKWITRINTFTCSTVIYPATGPESASRVSTSPVTFEDRVVSFEEIYEDKDEESTEIAEDLATASALSIGGWMTSALLRKSLSMGSIRGAELDKKEKEQNKAKREQAAALTIQGVWKLRKARQARAVYKQKQLLTRQNHAALQVQSLYRLRQYTMLKRKKKAAFTLTRFFTTYTAVSKYIRLLSEKHPHVLYVDVKEVRGIHANRSVEGGVFLALSAYDSADKAQDVRRIEASTSIFKAQIIRGITEARRGSVIAASIDSSPNDIITLRSHTHSTCIPPLSHARWKGRETLIATNVRGSSKVVFTLLQGSPADTPNRLVGQKTLYLNTLPAVYRSRTVEMNMKLEGLSVSVESPTGKALIGQSVGGDVKGNLLVSLRVPPLNRTMCGWVLKMSDGLLTKGSFKKRWVILVDGVMSYYEDPFTLDECKGKLRLLDVTEVAGVELHEGTGLRMVSNDDENLWTIMWDRDEPDAIRKMWSRKLIRCLPDDIGKNGLVLRTIHAMAS